MAIGANHSFLESLFYFPLFLGLLEGAEYVNGDYHLRWLEDWLAGR